MKSQLLFTLYQNIVTYEERICDNLLFVFEKCTTEVRYNVTIVYITRKQQYKKKYKKNTTIECIPWYGI